jgi:hypothetical protein
MEYPGARGVNPVHSYTPQQLFFLLRLTRLLRLKRQYDTMPHTEKYLIEMLNKAMYSTFMDCSALGIAADARDLIEKSRAEHGTAN